jgi:transporter family protein
MWILYAFLAAFTAALVAILAKLGLQNVDPTLATTLRSLIMALFLVLLSILLGKFNGFSISTSLNGREWALLTLAGIAGALSWLFYFFALKQGSASAVVAIDRLSLVFVIILAALFLQEAVTWRTLTGVLLMVTGALFISLKDNEFSQIGAYLLRLLK